MAFRTIPRLVIAAAGWLLAGSTAVAQSWELVLPSNAEAPTDEIHRSLDELAESARQTQGTSTVVLACNPSTRITSGRDIWRVRSLLLEFALRGISLSGVCGGPLAFAATTPSDGGAPETLRFVATLVRTDPLSILDRFGPVVYFDSGSTSLSPEARFQLRYNVVGPNLDQVGARVEGFADTAGSRASNLALSQARAQAIADELVRLGVKASCVSTVGLGEMQLAVPSADGEAVAGNRRAVVHLRWSCDRAD